MTGSRLSLEEFGSPNRKVEKPGAEEAALAEAQLAGFDKGYREGWEDAARAHAEEQKAIGADLARALDDMSFTYHEARTAMLAEMRGLIGGLLEKVLPAAARASLSQIILERIDAALTARSEVSVEVIVSPGNAARVEPLLQQKAPIPVRLAEEPGLGPGQAVLRFAGAEEIVDLEAVLEGIGTAVEGFFEGQETREG